MEGHYHIDENGIREKNGYSLTADMFRQFGIALGILLESRIAQKGKFLVAADSAVHDSGIFRKFIEGLHLLGVSVVNLGELPLPMLHYAVRRTRAGGCAVITNEGTVGLKWQIGETSPDSGQVETLKNLLARNEWGQVSNSGNQEVRFLNVAYDYVAWLQDTWFDSPGKKMHVVLETSGGPWTGRARCYLQAIFPQIVFSEVPDKRNPIRGIAEEVDRARAELGIIFGANSISESDSGQITAVDGYGIPLTTEELNWLLLQVFEESLRGETFLHDARCPSFVLSKAVNYGAIVREISSDAASFRRAMQETSAIFGADSRGHHYFRAICGDNDALFTACWLLDFLSHSDRTLAQHRESIPSILQE